MATLLELTGDLPALDVAPGELLVAEGGQGPLFLLVSGRLEVRKGAVAVATIHQPGAVVGEIAALLGTAYTADVVATEPSRVRRVDDGVAFLHDNPAALHAVAESLAQRLQAATAYLADLRSQYGATPGLTMVGEVLSSLVTQTGTSFRPGSAREPDPEY